MLRQFVGLGFVLLFALPAPAEDALHVAQAKQFLKEFRAHNKGTMAFFAAQSMQKYPYALVLFSLLESREYEAARKLVEYRAGAADGPGLQRLQRGYENGVRATPDERAAWIESERLLRGRKPADALRVLEQVGRPSEGTITGARLMWTRARALGATEKWEASLDALARASKMASDVGWLQNALAAEKLRLRIAQNRPQGLPEMTAEVLAAAGRVAELARSMDDRKTEMSALLARATIELKMGKALDARKDYTSALSLARSLNLPLMEGGILKKLGNVALSILRHPKRARRHYEDALAVFVRAGDEKLALGVRLNLARALTALAEYDKAIEQLDLLDQTPGVWAQASRSQRAYVRRRQGRLERSLEIYRELNAQAKSPVEKHALALDLGSLQLVRGDPRAALVHFESAIDSKPLRARALAGAAAAHAGLQQIERCRELFAQALEATTTPEARGRAELQWSAIERSFGNVTGALELVNAARGRLAREASTDYGNAAASWVVTADLLLLDEQREAALRPLAAASIFFARLQEPSRAIPAYARETLTLMALDQQAKYLDEILKRHGTLMVLSEGTSDPGLKGMAATVDGHFLHRRERAQEGDARFDAALEFARAAKNDDNEAAALTGKAIYAGAAGSALAEEAIGVLDRRPDRAPELHAFVAGERGDYAASIAVRLMLQGDEPDAERIYQLIERVRQARLQVALRGRDAILVRTLDAQDYAAYVAARGRLREARAVGEGLAEARTAFVRESERLRVKSPLAFTHVPSLKTVRAALGEKEALLLFLDDPYAQAVVAIDRERIVARVLDPKNRLAGLDEVLAGKQRLLLAPDGFATIDALKLKQGVLADAYVLRYCAGAASVVAARARVPAGEKRAALREESGPIRLDLLHPQASNVDLTTPETARLVLILNTVVRGKQGGTPDGIACVAEARLRAGADALLISVVGKADERIVARFRLEYAKTGDADAALRLTRAWARGQADLRDAHHWASLVLWGAR